MFEEFEDSDMFGDDVAAASSAQPLLPARQSSLCVGHDDIEKNLVNLINEKRLPHALIFAGQRGIGKSTMAFRLARHLLANPETDEAVGGGLFGDALPPVKAENFNLDPEHAIFRQVASGGHPDLMTVERPMDERKGQQKANVDVDSIRKITPFMRMTASQDGGWRVVVVNDADTMNRNAQNAILKILEEPPAHAVLILVTHRLGALIPTIRSRSRVVHFNPLSHDHFEMLIRQTHPELPDEDIDLLQNLYGGSVGKAMQCLEDEGLGIVHQTLDMIKDSKRAALLHGFSDTLSRANQDTPMRIFRHTILWLTESILRTKATNTDAVKILDDPAIKSLIESRDLVTWIETHEALDEHFRKLEKAHLDKRYGILGAFQILNA